MKYSPRGGRRVRSKVEMDKLVLTKRKDNTSLCHIDQEMKAAGEDSERNRTKGVHVGCLYPSGR